MRWRLPVGLHLHQLRVRARDPVQAARARLQRRLRSTKSELRLSLIEMNQTRIQVTMVRCGSTASPPPAHVDAGAHDTRNPLADAGARDANAHLVDASTRDVNTHLIDATPHDALGVQEASIMDAPPADTLVGACAKICTVEVTYPACFPPAACGDCVAQCNAECVNGGGLATGPCADVYLAYALCLANVGTITGCNMGGDPEATGCDAQYEAGAACAMNPDAGP
jgi:hypothetical protein